jgi:hypothetical protein
VSSGARCLLVLLATASIAGGAGAAWAQPALDCRADTAGQRVLLRVSLAELFDEELLRLVELGLVGRLRVTATLYRQRPLWFDARLAESSRELAVSWSRQESTFTIEGRPVERPNRLELPEMIMGGALGDAPDSAPAYVEVTARLEVITASSLGQVARWLVRGKAQGERSAAPERAESGSPLVPRALVNYLAADLARTASGRCPLRRSRRPGR